jgi:class 3 adenylate cyclase
VDQYQATARSPGFEGQRVYGDDMTATGLACGSCGTELRAGDKFCHECAAPVVGATTPAEYKQLTVLFADVVHSMDIAAALGAERLREIMTELVNRCAAVVQRYGGTVDKFTGDGIMAAFRARDAMEDSPVFPPKGSSRARTAPGAGGSARCGYQRRLARLPSAAAGEENDRQVRHMCRIE